MSEKQPGGITQDAFLEAFARESFELWLVGGAIRDRLLGTPGGDLDYATNALPDDIERVARQAGAAITAVGKRFGTIGVLVDGRWSEVTTFRGDSYTGGTRWPEVSFGQTIEEDLARRDFSVNALAENAFDGRVLDLFGGREDLAHRVIRAVGEPAQRFREDPLRILRGMRFASQLGFEVEPATLEGMEETVGLLSTLSQERVTAELDKLLQGHAPAAGLELIRATGALDVILPELATMPGCDQNRFHRFDVWGHTVATVAAIDGDTRESKRLRRWTALLHDLGKPAVRHTKPNGEWGFFRHETVGAELAAAMLDRLRLGRRESLQIQLLIRRHMDRPEPADHRSVRRFMSRCEGHWHDLLALKRADNASHTYDDNDYHDRLEAACAHEEAESAAALRAESPLSGNDLVDIFGREPGPWIRVIKGQLSAMVLDGELAPGDRVAAERTARRLMNGGKAPGTAPNRRP